MEAQPTIRAACDACGATYRVPAAGKTYACKKCGGTVRAEASPQQMPSCAACGAILPAGSRFCPECGSDPTAAAAPAPSSATREERRLAAHDLARASRAIRFVRGVYWFLAIVFGLWTAFALWLLGNAGVPLAGALLGVALTGVLTAMAAAGAAQVALRPFAWSLGIAALWSVNVLASTLGGAFPGPIPIGIGVGLWLALLPALRAGRLVREHPDLYASRRLLGVRERRDLEPGELRAEASRQAWRTSALRAALVLGTTALAAVAVCTTVRPQALAPLLTDFAGGWNRSDVEAVVGFVASDRRAAERARLTRTAAGRGWSPWPQLSPAPALPAEPDAASRKVVFALEEGTGELATEWRLAGRRWVLASLRLPPPPMDEALRSFTEAWLAGDPARIAELFPPASRDKLRSSLERLEQRRGWTAGYPGIRSHEVIPLDASKADVWFRTDAERFRTRWHLGEDDRWVLATLDPPD